MNVNPFTVRRRDMRHCEGTREETDMLSGLETMRKVSGEIARAILACNAMQARVNTYH